MTPITNTVRTYSLVGIREDLSDVIYNIDPTETPFMAGAGRGTADNTLFEWQTDALAAASTTNRHVEGADITAFDAITATVRLKNYTQISRKTLIVSGTSDKVKKAGRKTELAYQIAKLGKEIKRDMEANLLDNVAASAGTLTTARATGSLLAFVKTNTNRGGSGTDPVYTDTPNATRGDGTQRTFLESHLKDVIAKCWTAGAEPKVVMVGAFNKQVASGFAGVATKTYQQTNAAKSVIVGAADIYVSDFGQLTIVPNRFQRARDAHVLDFEHVSVDYLRPFQTVELAKTGDAEKRLMLAEYGLKVNNEKALGLVADLTTS